MNKKYIITLDGKRIGTTMLEMGDPPMGVVMGRICFEGISSGYELFHEYCQSTGLQPNEDDEKHRFINTPSIPVLAVSRPDGSVIEGLGTHVYGFDSDSFEITVFGVPHPVYEEEFPHHCRNYEERFKS